jgi:hypothetical protein
MVVRRGGWAARSADLRAGREPAARHGRSASMTLRVPPVIFSPEERKRVAAGRRKRGALLHLLASIGQIDAPGSLYTFSLGALGIYM